LARPGKGGDDVKSNIKACSEGSRVAKEGKRLGVKKNIKRHHPSGRTRVVEFMGKKLVRMGLVPKVTDMV